MSLELYSNADPCTIDTWIEEISPWFDLLTDRFYKLVQSIILRPGTKRCRKNLKQDICVLCTNLEQLEGVVDSVGKMSPRGPSYFCSSCLPYLCRRRKQAP